ncbi:MAG TPA: cupin domain-containing protein [Candidatus Limnocylindria bacterium]
MTIVRAAERGRSELRYGRGQVERIVGPEVGARNTDVHLNRILAGSAPGPYHVHRNAENVYLILSGVVRVRIDGVDQDLEPGDAAFIPAGMPHSASNVGTVDAEVLEIYAPPGPDFVEVAD